MYGKYKVRQNTVEQPSNHYDVLGLKPDATIEQIGRAARKGYLDSHPDTAKHPDVERFDRVREAHLTLGDPVSRTVYDEGLRKHDQKSGALTDDGNAFIKNIFSVLNVTDNDEAA